MKYKTPFSKWWLWMCYWKLQKSPYLTIMINWCSQSGEVTIVLQRIDDNLKRIKNLLALTQFLSVLPRSSKIYSMIRLNLSQNITTQSYICSAIHIYMFTQQLSISPKFHGTLRKTVIGHFNIVYDQSHVCVMNNLHRIPLFCLEKKVVFHPFLTILMYRLSSRNTLS